MTFPQLWLNILVLLAVLSQYRAEAASSDARLKLMKDLSKDQSDNAYLRPVNDTTEAVSVGFRFTPTISILDEMSQQLQLRGTLVLTWEDYRLKWNPPEYEDIQEIEVPLFKGDEPFIWKPELVLNESLVTDFQSFKPETTSVTLSHNGTIYWYTLATMTSFCRIAVQRYPFDKQTCHLTFTTWLYQNNEQTFYTVDDIIKNERYKSFEIKHGLWDLNILDVTVGNMSYDCSTCEGQEQSFVQYTLRLSRGQRWLYFLNLLLPCIVMSIMTSLAIWLPPKDDADAATFALTCILTLFVFMTFLFSILPSTGQPLIGYYIVWLIVEGVIVTFNSVRIARSLVTDRGIVTGPQNEPTDTQSVLHSPAFDGVVNAGSSTNDVSRETDRTPSKRETQVNDSATDGSEIRDAQPQEAEKIRKNDRVEYFRQRWRNVMIILKVVSSLAFFIMVLVLLSS